MVLICGSNSSGRLRQENQLGQHSWLLPQNGNKARSIVYTLNPSTQETEAGGVLGVQGQPGVVKLFQKEPNSRQTKEMKWRAGGIPSSQQYTQEPTYLPPHIPER